MKGNEQFAIGDVVRDKSNGRVGVLASAGIGKNEDWVIATQKNGDGAIIRFKDLEHVVADPAPAGSDIAETVIVGQDKHAKPAENIVIGIDLKVSDEGKAMLDKLQPAAENAKAVGLTSGSTEPKGLPLHEKDAIKQALLNAAKQGPLTYNTAEQLIEQFRQVDAA